MAVLTYSAMHEQEGMIQLSCCSKMSKNGHFAAADSWIIPSILCIAE